MSYFDTTIPADSEGVKLGAGRIRAMKSALNTVIAKIFDDAGNFLNKWVLGAMIANDAAVDGNRAIGPNHLQNGAVITRVLADGVLTADTTGRGKVADGFLSADATGRGKVADGFVTLAKLAWASLFTDAGNKAAPTSTDLVLIGDTSSTNVPKFSTIQQFMQAGVFTSPEQGLATSAIVTVGHGLPSTPRRLRWVLVCKTADAGYSVGEELAVSGARDNNNNNSLVVESADASNCFLTVGPHAWAIISKSTFTQVALTTASWRLKCYASL